MDLVHSIRIEISWFDVNRGELVLSTFEAVSFAYSKLVEYLCAI